MPDELGDVCGHGTACAGIVRSLAPACRLHSVRVLGEGNTGSADLILGGLRYAIEQGFDVVNLSLSTTKRKFAELLHELADSAYFRGTVLVASAHNMPVESYPWRFSSVISVGSHEGTDSWEWYREPQPAGRVLRAWHRHRRGLGRRQHAPLHGQQLRRAAHRRPLGARALEAPGADTLSAEERPLPDGLKHGRHDMTEGSSYQEAVAAGMLPSEESHRALLQSIVDVARAIFGARGLVDLPARPGDGRARLRGCLGRGRG